MCKTADTILYNVSCRDCNQMWTPAIGTPLWWKAKKRSKRYLDALCVSGEECGCIKKRRDPDAPYRVFGYTMDCLDFDIPFHSFTEAVKDFIEARKQLCEVFITGVSQSVQDKLRFG